MAAGSGLAVWARSRPSPANLTMWVCADTNARTYRDPPPDGGPSLLDQFQQRTGDSVVVDLIAFRGLDARLISLFMSHSDAAVPDVVEIEIGSVGKYFRSPTDEVGFLPLNDFLSRSGMMNKILPSRLAPWSKHGIIFGIPNDLHPVTLTYRKDLFDQAGVDLEAPRTWLEFQDACLTYQRYWADHGEPGRRAMELYTASPDALMTMLLQRHINIVDGNDRVHLSDSRTIRTLAFYAQMAAGPKCVGSDTGPGTGLPFRDLADGDVACMLTPDWRVGYLKQYAPELAGKVRMRPLPIFGRGDAPTSTWGGTMMGIPRRARNPEASWRLIEFLSMSQQGMIARHQHSMILSPVEDSWTDPIYQAPDPFFGGQKVEELFISLSPQVPVRYMTPDSVTAQTALALVLNKAVEYVQAHNGTDGLDDACALWLDEASVEVHQWVEHDHFGQ
jgi:arabinosaccharide transport system substrate-binding protein